VRRLAAIVACAAAAVALAACAPHETEAQRVTRIRRHFRIEPNGFQSRTSADGAAGVAVGILVVNEGRERLERLTLRVHVQGTDGRDRASAPAVVDTSALVPGVAAQLSAIARGLEVGPGETALVELEDEPAGEVLAGYPEYTGARGDR